MRDINECTAEVFRRSEKRIKERKRNLGRVLTLSIPLCLVAVVCSVIFIPSMETKNAADEMVGDVNAGYVCSYSVVEIQDAEYSEKVTDKAAVGDMYNIIVSFFPRDGAAQSTDEGVELSRDEAIQSVGGAVEKDKVKWNADVLYGSDSSPEDYTTITFTAEDGSQDVYILNENTLVKVNTNETVVLSDEQVAWLITVFGMFE